MHIMSARRCFLACAALIRLSVLGIPSFITVTAAQRLTRPWTEAGRR
jgi:hypothetical protein